MYGFLLVALAVVVAGGCDGGGIVGDAFVPVLMQFLAVEYKSTTTFDSNGPKDLLRKNGTMPIRCIHTSILCWIDGRMQQRVHEFSINIYFPMNQIVVLVCGDEFYMCLLKQHFHLRERITIAKYMTHYAVGIL